MAKGKKIVTGTLCSFEGFKVRVIWVSSEGLWIERESHCWGGRYTSRRKLRRWDGAGRRPKER